MSGIIKEETGPRDHQMHVSCFSEMSLLEKFVSELLFWWLSKQLGKPSSGPFAWLQVNWKPTLEIAPMPVLEFRIAQGARNRILVLWNSWGKNEAERIPGVHPGQARAPRSGTKCPRAWWHGRGPWGRRGHRRAAGTLRSRARWGRKPLAGWSGPRASPA